MLININLIDVYNFGLFVLGGAINGNLLIEVDFKLDVDVVFGVHAGGHPPPLVFLVCFFGDFFLYFDFFVYFVNL